MARSEDDNLQKPAKTIAEMEQDDKGIVRRWLAELQLADKAEEEWRTEARSIIDVYVGKEGSGSSFNILYSNTETLQPAVYNSTPRPDVRRRFRDADPVGKFASRVLERALSYSIDDYDFDTEINDVVQDVLLPGRGLARIKYEPKFVQVTPGGVKPAAPAGAYLPPPASNTMPVEQPSDAPAAGDNPALPSPEGGAPVAGASEPYEKIVSQSAECCHVQWNQFRHGPGKRWPDVEWISFEHEFTYEMAVEKFGPEIANQLKFSDVDGADTLAKGESSQVKKDVKSMFAVATVYEIWDKVQRRVLFIAPCLRTKPCGIFPDPLRLRGFFPIPRPIYAVRTSESLVPKPLYRFYKKQAQQLEDVSNRIQRITNALRVRGMYAKHINEASALLDADDNTMIATSNAQAIAEAGGLDKLIWIMPLDKLSAALEYLYKSRDQIKQAIYEISGLADVLRGATNPNETLGAQELKSQWGSLRINKLIKEIQRFVRDLMRLKAEIISEHFTVEQLQTMTNVELPDAAAKAQAQAAVQQSQQPTPDGQQPGAPPHDAVQTLQTPTWDDVMQMLTSDDMRQYRVDIETDSTVSDTIDQDMKGLAELLQQIAQVIGSTKEGFPMEAAKSIALSVVRRARMGAAVEDAVESLEQPPAPAVPPPPPDHSLEIAQMKEQGATDREHIKAQSQAQSDQMSAMETRFKTELDAAVKVIVAAMTAAKQADAQAQANARREFEEDVT